MSLTDDFIRAVEHATGKPGRRHGRETTLLCPSHDDHDPSLDVSEGATGAPIVQCRSHGCTYDQVCAAIGRQPRDFLPTDEGEWTPRGPAVAVYDYADETGRLLFQVCRTADKQFPQRRPDPTAKNGWSWRLGSTRRVLYRLPQVLAAAAAGEVVYIVEGEKDVHALERARVPAATCNPGGAGKWRPEYAATLAGAHVVVVADNDEPGRTHARTVAAAVQPTAASVRVVQPRTGKDAHDHLAAGLTVDDFDDLPADANGKVEQPFLLPAHDFVALQTRPPEPLWGSRDVNVLSAGGLTLLAGRPGVGKTTFLLDLACHLASGREAYGLPVPRPLRVAIIENEGPIAMFQQKLGEKLACWGDDFRDHDGYIGIHVWKWGGFSFADPEGFSLARQALEQERIDVVMGDPLGTLGMEGVGSPAETREFVQIIKTLGLTTTRAFLFLHHFRERVERNEDELAKISGAWGGHLDSLVTLSATGNVDQLRLAFPKLRWARVQLPDPLILGKVYNTATFEVLGTENDAAMLEPILFDHLQECRAQRRGFNKEGWKTATQLSDKDEGIGRRRKDIERCLKQAGHLFVSRTGEAAKALGARTKTTVLWGLRDWDRDPDEPLESTPDALQQGEITWR